jgi:hypothetical protein
LEALFRRCAADHHQAFLAENGADPEWPDWYAAYLQSPVSAMLGQTVTQSALVRWLVAVEEKRRQTGSNLDWPAFYAATCPLAPSGHKQAAGEGCQGGRRSLSSLSHWILIIQTSEVGLTDESNYIPKIASIWRAGIQSGGSSMSACDRAVSAG